MAMVVVDTFEVRDVVTALVCACFYDLDVWFGYGLVKRIMIHGHLGQT